MKSIDESRKLEVPRTMFSTASNRRSTIEQPNRCLQPMSRGIFYDGFGGGALTMRLGFFSGLIAAATVAAAMPVLCTSALADKRVALVIGNSAYKKVHALTNPANDAQAVGEIFRAAGFDVIDVRQNLDASGLRGAIRDFSQVVRDADVAVVFYAGHGIELDGNNY